MQALTPPMPREMKRRSIKLMYELGILVLRMVKDPIMLMTWPHMERTERMMMVLKFPRILSATTDPRMAERYEQKMKKWKMEVA
jgi:hypothetical protein